MAWRKERNDMRKTTMAQVVEFAGQLNVTLQNISEDENTHGLAEAYNRLAQVMDELCIPMRNPSAMKKHAKQPKDSTVNSSSKPRTIRPYGSPRQ